MSASLRPYLLASLIDLDAERPALVVAGDDRAARDLAADLSTFLAPRPVRFYPARGVRYESHLAPPPHLVGLRIAALDALLGEEPAVLVTSAVALAEKVPDPELRPHGFEIEKGGLLDLDETAGQLVACGYERVDQVEDRGQFALRGDILDVYPATEERAVRCELFDVEVERLTWFSTFTQRSLEEAERVEIAPAAELAPEHRELAEIAAASEEAERPDVAEVLPVDRFRELLDLVPDDALIAVAAEEELAPSLRDYWDDVTTSFHDEDAHHLYVPPDAPRRGARRARRAAPVEHLPGPAARVPRTERRHRRALAARRRAGAREARALGLPHVRRLGAPRRGGARRATTSTRVQRRRSSTASRRRRSPASPSPHASLREGFLAPGAEARDPARAPAAAPPPRRAPVPAGRRRGAIASFTDLRAGAPVVHEDHGIAQLHRLRDQDGRRVTRDYLELEFTDGDRVFVPSDQLHKISRYVGADAGDPPLSKLGGKQWEQMKLRARRAAEALAGRADQPLRRAPPPRRPRVPARRRVAARVRGRASPTARRPTSSTRSRRCARTWRRRARWTA